jgi:hypothetical protein
MLPPFSKLCLSPCDIEKDVECKKMSETRNGGKPEEAPGEQRLCCVKKGKGRLSRIVLEKYTL